MAGSGRSRWLCPPLPKERSALGRFDKPKTATSLGRMLRRCEMATANYDLNEIKRRMQGAIQVLKQELGGLRTGRASARMPHPVQGEGYRTHMPLNQPPPPHRVGTPPPRRALP